MSEANNSQRCRCVTPLRTFPFTGLCMAQRRSAGGDGVSFDIAAGETLGRRVRLRQELLGRTAASK